MRDFWTLARIIDLKSLVLSALAVLVTWICLRLKITADFPLTLIATAIVFPLVFSISNAYKRREKALEEYGSIKAHGRALYLAARDWVPASPDERAASVEATLLEMLRACRDLFTNPIDQVDRHEPRVYREFDRLSEMVTLLRADGLAPTECSRCNQYISRIILSFENIKHIYQYRTPRTLRAFSHFFILLLPILYGPYFAYQMAESGTLFSYSMPVLFTLILVALSNIQDNLENPFDQIGEDDVAINAEAFIASLRSGEHASSGRGDEPRNKR